jgi:hypothetical protein
MPSMDKSPLFLRVTVVGLTGKQASVLWQEVGREFDLRVLTLERALRIRANASDVVITTRFIGHKHEKHLRRVSGCLVLCLQSGCAQAVAIALKSFAVSLAEAA